LPVGVKKVNSSTRLSPKNFSTSDARGDTNSKLPAESLVNPKAIESAFTALEISKGEN
jgi:hypothetical protein